MAAMANFQTNSRGAGKKFNCYHCGGKFTKRCSLDRHIRQQHGQSFTCTQCGKECTRSKNLEMHMRTCTGSSTPAHRGGAASCSSTPAHRGGAANTQARSFAVRRNRRALEGAVVGHSVDMGASNQLVALRL